MRAHSIIITLLTLAIMLALADRLTNKLGPLGADPTAILPSGVPTVSIGPSVGPASATPQPTPTDRSPQTVYAAGDIADCPDTVPEVAQLIRDPDGVFLAVGDIVYPSGQARAYRRCFIPIWGDLKSQIRPVPGNHDYKSGSAAAYFDYFGSAAGDSDAGYYSFDLGAWHLIALNSMCQYVGGCRRGSPQVEWLQADLAAHPAACTLAYFHHPRFSSGDGASPRRTAALWEALYAAGADVVINGHDHDYERFSPMNPHGQLDPDRGIREFIVGTGGANLTARLRVARHSEVWTRDYHGLLEMTLKPGRYDWRFIAAETRQVIDAGFGRCH